MYAVISYDAGGGQHAHLGSRFMKGDNMKTFSKTVTIAAPADVSDEDAKQALDDLLEYGSRDAELDLRVYGHIESETQVKDYGSSFREPLQQPDDDDDEAFEVWYNSNDLWQADVEAFISGHCSDGYHQVRYSIAHDKRCKYCNESLTLLYVRREVHRMFDAMVVNWVEDNKGYEFDTCCIRHATDIADWLQKESIFDWAHDGVHFKVRY